VNAVVQVTRNNSLVARMAERFGVDPTKMLATLKATAFKGNVSDEQMMALLVVADQHGLNPWTKEIYAFPSQNGIVPVVGVDGWARIINSHPQFDGMEFTEAEDGAWIECAIYRKDRHHPTKVREWMIECKRTAQGPWQSHPRRMLRHKALIQCARIAFSFSGIYDQDEAERIVEVEAVVVGPGKVDPRGDLSSITDEMCEPYIKNITDILNSDQEEHVIAKQLLEHEIEMSRFHEIAIRVADLLAQRGICKKAAYKKWIDMANNTRETHAP
jgi:phage recombination protein Bet